MKLYLLRPVKDWDPWYDKAFGFVVAANGVDEARAFASENAGDERKDVWLDYMKTRCTLIAESTDCAAGVVIRDFAAA